MISNTIKTTIEQALDNLGLPQVTVELEHPADEAHGDYSSNVAMAIFSNKKLETSCKSPRELAGKIVEEILSLSLQDDNVIQRVEVAGPGFINFYLSDHFLTSGIPSVLTAQEAYGVKDKADGPLTYIEHTQPNTNKPLHIGHLRNTVLGDALVRILKAAGKDVVSTDINNDRGIAIVRSMWGYLIHGTEVSESLLSLPQNAPIYIKDWQQELDLWHKNPDFWKQPEDFGIKPDHWVGKFYVMGANAAKESEEAAEQMQHILREWEDGNEVVRNLWKQMNEWFYEGERQTLSTLHILDLEVKEYESELYRAGKEIILEAAKTNPHFKTLEDGAIQAVLEPFGLPNKILVRRDGTAIYMTFDIELTRKRTQDYGMERGVWVVGSDQELHFRQLFQICELLEFGKKEQWKHFSYGMVELPEGKMSSRTGKVITADEVIDTAIQKTKEVMEASRISKSDPEEDASLVQDIAVAAIKYGILAYKPQSKIKFDMNSQVSFEGNSGPYIQYTHARAMSVLSKTEELDITQLPTDLTLNTEEQAVLRFTVRFPEVIEQAAEELAPHHLAAYLYELSQRFNAFYHKHSVLQADTDEEKKLRLGITASVAQILKNGLELLGIEAPEKM